MIHPPCAQFFLMNLHEHNLDGTIQESLKYPVQWAYCQWPNPILITLNTTFKKYFINGCKYFGFGVPYKQKKFLFLMLCFKTKQQTERNLTKPHQLARARTHNNHRISIPLPSQSITPIPTFTKKKKKITPIPTGLATNTPLLLKLVHIFIRKF